MNARLTRGESLTACAKRVGIPPKALLEIEAGKRYIDDALERELS